MQLRVPDSSLTWHWGKIFYHFRGKDKLKFTTCDYFSSPNSSFYIFTVLSMSPDKVWYITYNFFCCPSIMEYDWSTSDSQHYNILCKVKVSAKEDCSLIPLTLCSLSMQFFYVRHTLQGKQHFKASWNEVIQMWPLPLLPQAGFWMQELLHTLFYVNLPFWLENKNHMSGIKCFRMQWQTGLSWGGCSRTRPGRDTIQLTERLGKIILVGEIFQVPDRCGYLINLEVSNLVEEECQPCRDHNKSVRTYRVLPFFSSCLHKLKQTLSVTVVILHFSLVC